MLGILCAAVVTTGAGYMIIKKYYAQTVLISAGMILMFLAWLFNLTPAVLDAKRSLGFIGFDLFEAVHRILSTRIAGLGLSIMAIAGFAKYMDQINASQALFDLVGAPLQKIKNPYILTVLAFIVSTFLGLFIPSTAGHAMLLMVTIYPLMIRVGVTRMSALCVIACSRLLDLGPGSGNAIMAAVTAGMDVGVYFFEWQGRIAIPVVLVVSVVLYFMLPWMDKRDGEDTEGREQLEALEAKASSSPKLPKIYALLPCLPLFFILGFSPVITKPLGIKVKMTVVTAMMISTFLAMLFEYARLRDHRKVINSLKVFFEGMGIQFVVVVSLIISGETFAKGLTDIGAVSTMINSAKEAGFGLRAMVFCTCFIITLFSFLMGSGNAPFFSFAALGPGITKALGVEPIILLMPMEFASSIGRTMSPVSTLEEKSLGAIAKAGTSPVQGVLQYGERPKGKGLYFIDSWMSSYSIPLCFTASGANIVMYQLGGGAMAEKYPSMLAVNPTIVSPWLYTTGNKYAYASSPDNIDFDASPLLEGKSLTEMGAALLDHLIDIASGTYTKMETLQYQEPLEIYMEGPVL